MRFWAAAGLLLLAAASGAEAEPRRIVSINLCADPYVMALADRDQIAALSPFSRDASMSYYYKQAGAYPNVRSTAEAVLALKPDLVLSSPFLDLETRTMLRHFHVPMVDLGDVKNFSGIEDQTRAMAKLFGHPERGEKLVAAMQDQLAALPPSHGRKPVAVHYQRQGYVTGINTLMDDMMARAGLSNLAGRLGDMELAHIDLESIVAARPDYIIFTTEPGQDRDWGSLLLHHPALSHAFAGRALYIPDNLVVCGGPEYPLAVARLAAQIH